MQTSAARPQQGRQLSKQHATAAKSSRSADLYAVAECNGKRQSARTEQKERGKKGLGFGAAAAWQS